MKLEIEDNRVNIATSGIELLKIKASLNKFLGGAVASSHDKISFPLSCLDIAINSIPEVAALLPNTQTKFSLHAIARTHALDSLNSNNVAYINDFWADILDLPQQFAVNAMLTPNLLGLCLFDEQGSGKTVMSIAAFDMLKQSGIIDAMIVVCPKSMLQGWHTDLSHFLGNKYSTSIAQGSSIQKRIIALSGFDVLISNYEGLDTMLIPLCGIASRRNFLLIVDESYYAKNERADRSQSVIKLRNHCSKCFVLCGTPAPNSPYDLISQFNISDLGYTFSTFSKTDDLEADKLSIKDLISTRGMFIRRLKNEILSSVPDKKFQIIKVKLSGRQREMYEKARKSLVLELRSYDNRKFKKNLASYFQKRSALLQICAIPTNIDPTFSDTPVKYEELDKLLEKLLGEKRKVIIWTSYRASIDELTLRYSRWNPLVIDGETSLAERKDAVDKFQNDSTRFLFIANPSAAGAGITLHASHDAIYMSYTNQAAHYLQSLDRIHRRGQRSECVNYYLFVCENTIEESEVQRLRAREIQQHDLLGDVVPWPTSLDDALAELSSPGIN